MTNTLYVWINYPRCVTIDMVSS